MATRFPSEISLSASQITIGVLPVPPTVRFPTLTTGAFKRFCSANHWHRARRGAGRFRHIAATEARAASVPAPKYSSSRTVHEFCDFRERTIGGTAAGFDKVARGGTHFLRSLGIAEKFDPGDADIFGTLYL